MGLSLLAADADRGAVFAVGAVVFVLSAPTYPAKWWRYVRTGTHPKGPVPARFVESGACRVELRSPGDRPLEVVKVLREVTEAGFAEAKDKVQNLPATVATDLSPDSAEQVRDRIEGVGATAVVVTDAH